MYVCIYVYMYEHCMSTVCTLILEDTFMKSYIHTYIHPYMGLQYIIFWYVFMNVCMYVCRELKNEVCAKMDIQNIDTDMIIPKQFLKTIQRSGERAVVCMYVCVYVCMYVSIYIDICTIYTACVKYVPYILRVCIHTYIVLCTHVCMISPTLDQELVYVCMYVCMYVLCLVCK